MGLATIPASTVGPSGCRSNVKLLAIAEIAAASAQAPEQFLVLQFAGHGEVAIGGDDVTGADDNTAITDGVPGDGVPAASHR